MGMNGWLCLPLSIVLGGGLVVISMMSGARFAAWLRTVLVLLLLPGVLLVFRSGMASGIAALACRAVGAVPVLALPLLAALGRVPPGQVRAAIGLGAGRAARFRLLWLPLLGPACLAGLLLAGLVQAAATVHVARSTATLSVLARPS